VAGKSPPAPKPAGNPPTGISNSKPPTPKPAPPLWSAAELANGEFIADFQLSKTADLSKPCTGICVRGQNNPAVLIGTGQAPIVFGPDQVKPGKWYRLRLKLDGKQATATLTETHEANPQTMEATLEAPAKGPIALADLGTPVTFANFFLRE